MNYKLRTFRGDARMANLCLERRNETSFLKKTRSNSLKLLFIPIFLCCFYFTGYSQQWEAIGPDDFNLHTLGTSSYEATAADANGNLYVAFKDGTSSNKATVKKYDGNSWTTVGNAAISSSEARALSMAVDGNNVPYVAFQEYGGSKKATVMKYDGNSWVHVGTPEFTSGQASSIRIVMDNNDVPHITYVSSNKVTVEKFDGTNWVTVGNAGFSTTYSYYPSLAFDVNNIPYLSYVYRVWNGGNNRTLELRQFDGTNWVIVSSFAIHSSSFSNLSMAIDSTNTPYIAYGYSSGAFYYTSVQKYDGTNWGGTSGNSGAALGSSGSTNIAIAGNNTGTVYTIYSSGSSKLARVRKLDGSTWVDLGSGSSSTVSGAAVSGLVLAVSPDDNPYVSYYSNGGRTFKQYDGSDWTVLGGNEGITEGQGADKISLTIDGNNIPYISYSYYWSGNTGFNSFTQSKIKKYDGTKWVEIGTFFPADEVELITDSNNDLYAIYKDESKYSWNYSNGKASAKKYNGTSWAQLGSTGFTSSSLSGHDVAIDGNDVLYLAYRSSVMKSSGGSWVTVGNANFSIGTASDISIAIDNSNVPYVVYHDNGDSSKATVKKFDGTTWVAVGATGFSAGEVDYTSIAIDGNNVPYVVYEDVGDSSKATVKKFDGTNWVNVGSRGFSPSAATYTTIIIDNNNIPYVAYRDGANGDNITVVKFDGTNWVNVGSTDISQDDVRENAMALNPNGDVVIGYHHSDGMAYAKYFNPNPPATPAFDTDIAAQSICPDATEWLVPIDVATIPSDIGAVSLVLDYDNTKMTYDTIIGHANMDAANNPIVVSDNNGKITIGWIKTSGATISNETLLTLKFVPAGGAADFSAIAGQTADFTWDQSTAGNCQLAGTLGDVMTTTFNDLTGAIVNTAPTAGLTSDATNNTTLCAGDNVTFTATGSTTYSFDVNGGTPVAGTGTNGDEFSSATLVNGDIVTVTVTDANGCSSTATLTMVINPLPTAGLTSDATTNTTLCAGDNITFIATGGTSYSFDVNSGTPVAGTGTNGDEFSSATLANGDVVTVTVTNANGCSSTDSLTMVVNPLPTVTLSSDDVDNTICAGDNVTFTGAGATSYSFDVNGGTAVAGTGTNGDEFSSATLANGDIVTVTGTDANGCNNTASITMTVNSSPTAGLTSDKAGDVVCDGETITFTGTGTVIVAGNGNALDFDGSDDYVTMGNVLSKERTDAFTLEAWIKTTFSSQGQIVSKMLENNVYTGYEMKMSDNGKIVFELYNTYGTDGIRVTTTGTYNNGSWRHVAVTYDGSSSGSGVTIYIDGSVAASIIQQDNLTTSTLSNAPLCIGTRDNGNWGDFEGLIDEVRIWNNERSASEILNSKDIQLNGNESGLQAYYDFNHGVAGGNNAGVISLTDKTSNANHGTLINFMLSGNASNWVTGALSITGSYEFFVNGASVQAASATATYASDSLTNGDKVKVKVTNGNGCIAESAEITVTVNALPTTTLASDDSDSRICQGQAVTFTASSSDGADEFIFVSSIDGTVQVQSATATYTDNGLQDGEVISAIGVNSTTGCQQAADTAFTIDADGCHSVSGNLVYKNAPETPMGNVVITVTGPGLAANTTITTDVGDGSFSIANLFENETYNFSYATTKTHGGINATDALFALLDAVSLVSQTGLNATAGDVDISGDILSDDALDILRRFALYNVTTFPSGVDWVFDAGSFTPTANVTGAKLYALAMGDINGSYVPNIAENGTPTVSMINDGQMVVNDGDRVQIPVSIKSGADVGAMSLSMFFPSNAMTIHDVTLADGTSMLNKATGDEVRVAWADITAKLFADDDVVYYIDATINDVTAYNAAPIGVNNESEFANGSGSVLQQVVLGVPTIQATLTNTNAIETAAANVRSFPNPFSNQMTIEYDLPSTSNVTIQIFNSLGQEMATLVNDTQVQGRHRTIWNADNQAAGVYFYTITIADGDASYKQTKQVIIVK